MVYQISEKNQILIALLSIVVLCAGKLFKDYFNRMGYIEGFTFTTESDPVTLKRGASDVKGIVYLIITLGKDLPSAGKIEVVWSGDAANDIEFSTVAATDYIATIESETGGTTSPFSKALDVNTKKVIFTSTASTAIKSGSWVKIAIKNITLKAGISIDKILKFTVSPSNDESPISRDVKINRADSTAGSGDFVSSTRVTASDIRKAIDSIDLRLNASPAPADADRISLLQARSSLVSMLASTYGTVKEAGQVFDSEALYAAQKTAIDFIRKEKERAEKNANMLSQDNSNKRRMAQVNTYYTRHYEANTDVMKNIIYVSIALIILAVLRNKELIPASIATLGVIIILTFGGIIIGTQVYDIIMRNDHDFDKYDWNFNEDEMNRKQLIQQNSDPANLSEMGMGMAPCYGPGCCDVGTMWDNDSKKCVPSIARITGKATWTTSGAGAASGDLKIILKVSSTGALTTSNTITIILPKGLFTSNATISGDGGAKSTGTPTVDQITLTPTAAAANDATIPEIIIKGLSLSDAYSSTSKVLKVKTSSDQNESGITITGI
jgi:hypothetical protein